jgi:hypothetical protein
MSTMIEKRAYGPDSSEAEIAALRALVGVHAGIAAFYEEVPVMSCFQIEVCFGRVEELLHEHDLHGLIVDLRRSGRPGAAVRDKLRTAIAALAPQLERVAVFTGRNLLINVAARFVMAGLPQPLYVCKTLAEAEEFVGGSKSDA